MGLAFYEQGQDGIAEAVLRRANTLEGTDDEKIGVLYWYGRALEAKGRGAEALPWYEQAVALDIRFLDVRERLHRLGAEKHRCPRRLPSRWAACRAGCRAGWPWFGRRSAI